jgi:hypothetical protein
MAIEGLERRKSERAPSSVLKRDLNEAQRTTLMGLEQFGWELKFVRRKPFQPSVAVVFDGDRKHFAVLEPDGTLNESPGFEIRGS